MTIPKNAIAKYRSIEHNSSMADYKRDTKEIVQALLKQGWRIRQGRACHYVAYPPDRRFPPVAFSATPSDNRGIRNNLALLKKYGADLKIYG